MCDGKRVLWKVNPFTRALCDCCCVVYACDSQTRCRYLIIFTFSALLFTALERAKSQCPRNSETPANPRVATGPLSQFHDIKSILFCGCFSIRPLIMETYSSVCVKLNCDFNWKIMFNVDLDDEHFECSLIQIFQIILFFHKIKINTIRDEFVYFFHSNYAEKIIIVELEFW